MTRRRDSGDGYLAERKVKGKVVGWVGTFEVAPVNGKRRRRAVYGLTRQETKAKLIEAMRLHAGQPTASQGTTEEWLNRWIREVVTPKAKPKTLRGYRDIVTNRLIPALGTVPLVKLTRPQVRTMLISQLEGGLSAGSVHNVRACLRAALEVAKEDGLIAQNVAIGKGLTPAVVREEMTILQPEQASAFQDAVRTDREATLYLFALQSGFRQGEVLGLSWGSVDLDAGSATVSQALQKVEDKGLVLITPKSKSSRRTIDLGAGMVTLLREHRAGQREERLRLGDRWLGRDELVFTTEFGAPVEGTALTRRFQALLQRARLPRLRFHDLRHTCAVWLLMEGQTVHEVAAYLGHSSPALVLSTYGKHIVHSRRPEAARSMERIFARGASA